MNHPSSTPQEHFATIVEELRTLPGITPPSDEPQSKKKFGSSALKVNNKIFAMLVEGKLVVKLPKQRVDALIASRAGERYDPRRNGRLMKEWITIEPTSGEDWLNLSKEAMEFVVSQR